MRRSGGHTAWLFCCGCDTWSTCPSVPSVCAGKTGRRCDGAWWCGLLLLLRASVIEEILFRGYIIEKVKQLTGSAALACLVSICTFTYAHLSAWDWRT